LPFVMNSLVPPPDVIPLVIELQGTEANQQTEEKVAQQTPEEQPQAAAAPAPPQEAPPPEPEEEAAAKPPEASPQPPTPPQAQTAAPAPVEQEQAQTLKVERDIEAERVLEYVKQLAKKAKANLIYPDGRAALKGSALVSFALTADGQIRSGTLAIAKSSGKPKLDAAALATIRACAPFDPPPREMRVAFTVDYE